MKKTSPKKSPPKKGENPMQSEKGDLPFIEHLRELRKRLIYSIFTLIIFFPVAYYFYHEIVAFLYKPFDFVKQQSEDSLYITGVLEGLLVRLKVSFFVAFLFSFPFHLYHVMRFIFPGLYSREKKIVSIMIALSFLFVFFSVYYTYEQIIPISVSFLLSSGFIPQDVGLLLSFERNVFFVLQFLFAGLILFQLPILLQVLLIMDVIKRRALVSYTRYIVICIFVVSAFLTPPDPLSLLALSLPLVLMFLLTLLIAKIFNFGADFEDKRS